MATSTTRHPARSAVRIPEPGFATPAGASSWSAPTSAAARAVTVRQAEQLLLPAEAAVPEHLVDRRGGRRGVHGARLAHVLFRERQDDRAESRDLDAELREPRRGGRGDRLRQLRLRAA